LAKAFLSHSSIDKKSYVEIVARQLGYDNCIYDELTFEEGMKSIEEIEKRLSRTDIFAIFLSDSALNSKWVKLELEKAHELLNNGDIKRIFPLIIDNNIDYYDKRIPHWMRKEYNLKYVSKPTIATRRIKQRLREISWQIHPLIKEKEKIFVGRNDLIRQFEERIDNFDKTTPLCFIASGIEKIGRQSLIKHCLKKANIIDDAYQPPIIMLNSHESLEDFILKVDDLGLSSQINKKHFLKRKVHEKISIAAKITEEVQNAKELIFIIDHGCIVTPEGLINKWFSELLQSIPIKRVTFGIASSFRLIKRTIRWDNNIFTVDVPELDIKERAGLLKRYAELEKLELSRNDLAFFSSLLNGYPEQVYYAVDLIGDNGLSQAKKDYLEIVGFSSEKVTKLLWRYEQDTKSRNFLSLLSKFDFIGYDLIFKVVEDEKYFKGLLNKLLSSAICEYLGANKEYIRLNDAVRDYISRMRYELPKDYANKLKEHLEDFWVNYKSDEIDVADFLYSVKETLRLKKDISEEYLIPSHFLKTMVETYNISRRYNDVVKLADRVLQNAEYMDDGIKKEIRYYLCLSLARLQRERFFAEVMGIQGPDHDFLCGFYYRLSGNSVKAIERLMEALRKRPNFPRAKRELVQVYLYIGDYETALELAKSNYDNDKANPYHIQAYFRSLIRNERIAENGPIMEELLTNLRKIRSDKAKEMFLEAQAQYEAFFRHDGRNALIVINSAIKEFPDSVHLKITKFDICEKFNVINEMKDALDEFEKTTDNNSYFYNIYTVLKSIYLAKIGQKQNSLDLLDKLKNYPDTAVNKLRGKIRRY
jgi:hypothetical protein